MKRFLAVLLGAVLGILGATINNRHLPAPEVPEPITCDSIHNRAIDGLNLITIRSPLFSGAEAQAGESPAELGKKPGVPTEVTTETPLETWKKHFGEMITDNTPYRIKVLDQKGNNNGAIDHADKPQ